MPPKTSKTKETFETWWNENIWDTEPFRPIYKALYDAGADLNYVEFLRWGLKLGDRLAELAQSKNRTKEVHRIKGVDTILGFPKDIFIKKLRAYASTLIEFTLDDLRENNKVNSSLDTLSLIPPERRRKIISDATQGITGLDLLQPFWEQVTEQQEIYRKNQQRLMDEQKGQLSQYPFFSVLEEYAYFEVRRGNQPDPWGSFFLLAITEHLREKCGNPHYLAVFRLLRTLRGQPPGSRHANRLTATNRVSQLKKDYPKWQYHLQLIKKQFAKSRRANRSPLKSQP